MKLMNYDTKTLIMQNVKTRTSNIPNTFSKRQHEILCNLIRQKKISKRFFYFLLQELYDLSDWRKLNYQQMYELIGILTHYNYER